jgi:hypothetical protein
MPNYRAYVVSNRYRAFEFEADNDELAYDHIEKLINDYQFKQEAFLAMSDESGPDELTLDEIEEI